jgi:hypothetical protein
MHESEAAAGDSLAVGWEGEMIVAGAVGKWESRVVGGISKRRGKPAVGFPRSGFSTARGLAQLECAGYDFGPLFRFDS